MDNFSSFFGQAAIMPRQMIEIFGKALEILGQIRFFGATVIWRSPPARTNVSSSTAFLRELVGSPKSDSIWLER